MDKLNPIYTEKTECQDCFKCVRSCPVKAINVVGGSAQVVYDECILCGQCVGICPARAKRVRKDTGRARQLIGTRGKTVVSLAPSFFAQGREERNDAAVVKLFRKLGFDGVSETALGAQEITQNLAGMIKAGHRGVLISSACPVIVDLIAREFPQYMKYVSPLLSPMLAHGKLLKKVYGPETGVVFVGPCIAKKREADLHPELVDLALTFRELGEWIKEERIEEETDESTQEDKDRGFVPAAAQDGRLYPVDGGMADCLSARLSPEENAATRLMFFSGISQVKKALRDIERLDNGRETVFLELLACEGGCINGPMAENDTATAVKRIEILRRHDNGYDIRPDGECIAARTEFQTVSGRREIAPAPEEMAHALNSIGKFTAADELNCGACGYDSCRDFAGAMLAGKAEKNMCLSYMRKLAQKKALALMSAMPSGVVIANQELNVVESNRRFAELLGGKAQELYDTLGSLENAAIAKISPLGDMFEDVFDRGTGIIERNVKAGDKVLKASVFVIEQDSLAGGVVQDITAPARYRQEIIRKSQQVIQSKIETVQKVAYLLGNDAAESEVLLSSVIDLFAAEGAQADDSK